MQKKAKGMVTKMNKLKQFKIDFMLTNGRRGSVYVTGKNERNAITNALINRIDKIENAEIKIITINKV